MSVTPFLWSNCSARLQKGQMAVQYMLTWGIGSTSELLFRDGQPGLLPSRDAAGQIVDSFETAPAQGVAGRTRTVAGLTDHDHRLVPVLVQLSQPLGYLPHRHGARVGHMAGGIFVGLA